jgi:hypothetical protein
MQVPSKILQFLSFQIFQKSKLYTWAEQRHCASESAANVWASSSTMQRHGRLACSSSCLQCLTGQSGWWTGTTLLKLSRAVSGPASQPMGWHGMAQSANRPCFNGPVPGGPSVWSSTVILVLRLNSARRPSDGELAVEHPQGIHVSKYSRKTRNTLTKDRETWRTYYCTNRIRRTVECRQGMPERRRNMHAWSIYRHGNWQGIHVIFVNHACNL